MTETEVIEKFLLVCEDHAGPVYVKKRLTERFGYDRASTVFRRGYSKALMSRSRFSGKETLSPSFSLTNQTTNHHLLPQCKNSP